MKQKIYTCVGLAILLHPQTRKKLHLLAMEFKIQHKALGGQFLNWPSDYIKQAT